MYTPAHFRLSDELVEEHLAQPRAATLVTVHEEGPQATLVPMLLERRGDRRVLLSHLVRPNPQACQPADDRALVVVDIADAYVSPAWYATNEAMPSVPTWDYLTIHLRGRVRVDPSPEAALRAAMALTEAMGETWSTDLVGEEKLARMARAIVAVEVEVEQVEGKAKMSQNRHPDDIVSLAEAFEGQGHAALAAHLREVSLPYARQRLSTTDRLRREHGLG